MGGLVCILLSVLFVFFSRLVKICCIMFWLVLMMIGLVGMLLISVFCNVLCCISLVLCSSLVMLVFLWLGFGIWVKCENLLMIWCRLLVWWMMILVYCFSVLCLFFVMGLNLWCRCLVDSWIGVSGFLILCVMWCVILFYVVMCCVEIRFVILFSVMI